MKNNTIPFPAQRTLPRAAEFAAHIDRGERAPLPCTVRDMTFSGARVSAPETALPERFTLLINGGRAARRTCRVTWREHYTVGVEFVE